MRSTDDHGRQPAPDRDPTATSEASSLLGSTIHPGGVGGLSRRAFIGGGAAAVGLIVAGCSSSDNTADPTTTSTAATSTTAATDTSAATDTTAAATTTVSDDAATVFSAADFEDLGICQAMPEQMAGPFPSPELLLRRDVIEDRDGVPLRVGAQVVDANCDPVEGAVLEIWHCDVDGDYSAYLDGESEDDAGPGTTFLRGYQVTDADGIVEFHTIFPGWYTGRAVHIHTRVHRDDDIVLTSQWYFEGEVCDAVFTDPRYRGPADTSNADDLIAADDPGQDGTMMTVSDDADNGGKRALIRVGLPI